MMSKTRAANEMERDNGDHPVGQGDAARGHVLCRNCAQVPAETMQLLQGPVVLPELPVIVPKSSPESDRHKPGTLYKAIRRRMAELEAQNGDLDPATRTLVDRLRGPVRDMNGHARFLREAYPTLSGEKLLDCLERLCRQAQELETIVDELLQQVSIRPKGAEIPSQE